MKFMKKLLKALLIFFIFIVLISVSFILLSATRVLTINQLKSSGMSPYIKKDQFVLSTNLVTAFKKDDVVIYRTKNDGFFGDNVDKIARINAVGEDTIITERGDKESVPKGSFYLLLDEREAYGDSRKYGFISRNDVLGRAILVF